jgi:hypothetical protein
MIDVMENKILGPAIRQGIAEGQQDMLRELLTEKFGTLPAWAAKCVAEASSSDMHRWARRILTSATIEDTLG